MKNNPLHLLNLLAGASILLSACSTNDVSIYSDKRFTPIAKVDLKPYKSPQLRANQNAKKAIGLTVSGGGSRAQYFSFGVLMGLDDIKVEENTFLKEIDYFSVVSGGCFGSGHYMSLEHNGVLKNHNSLFDYWKSADRKALKQELFANEVKPLSILEVRRIEKGKKDNPFPKMIDTDLLLYGKTYENKKIERLLLGDFFIPKASSKEVTLPLYVANGAAYNNVERIPMIPHIINSIGLKGSLLPVDNFDIDNGYGLPLTYAISGSSAFPGILPMVKMSLSNKSDEVIRLVDGGLVDNLGHETLFELLNSDPNDNKDKSMLIIDCGGFGLKYREQDAGEIKLTSILSRSLLFSVDIQRLYSDDKIKLLTSYYDLEESNIKRIGICTIKDKYIALEKTLDAPTLKEINTLKTTLLSEEMKWEELYSDLAKSTAFKGYTEQNLSELPTSRFAEFTPKDIFEICELTSQVSTSIDIEPLKKELLILAGRYTVHLEREAISRIGH